MQTLYLNEESDRKQLTMEKRAYEHLKTDEDETATKSMKAYEAILFHFDEYRDAIDDYEDRVDDELIDIGTSEFHSVLEKISSQKDSVTDDEKEKVSHVNIHLPESLVEQFTFNRYLGRKIQESVYDIESSAYQDRLDRIQCKEQVIEYIKDNRKLPSHDIARSIVEGESELYDVAQAHELLTDITGNESSIEIEDQLKISDELYIDDLRDVEHTSDGRGFNKNQKEKRIEALRTAIKNEIDAGDVARIYDEERIIELSREIYDVSEVTARKYFEQIEVDWIDISYIDMEQMATEAVQETIEEENPKKKIANKIERMANQKACRRDPEIIKQGHFDSKQAVEYLQEGMDASTSKYDKKQRLQIKIEDRFRIKCAGRINELNNAV